MLSYGIWLACNGICHHHLDHHHHAHIGLLFIEKISRGNPRGSHSQISGQEKIQFLQRVSQRGRWWWWLLVFVFCGVCYSFVWPYMNRDIIIPQISLEATLHKVGQRRTRARRQRTARVTQNKQRVREDQQTKFAAGARKPTKGAWFTLGAETDAEQLVMGPRASTTSHDLVNINSPMNHIALQVHRCRAVGHRSTRIQNHGTLLSWSWWIGFINASITIEPIIFMITVI